ncbi:dorsal interacting protein 2 [Haematobia irritans]|uniref:dorsal interacting protein 2 n=1 Tax=Haematobia irritans TaxID=7368 RepID=UPI003F4F8A26
MALKTCVYRNCQNFTNALDRNCSNKPNITLFQFPKNPKRRQKWMELGKAPPNLPANYYYYCSEHFDKRFLNVGARRTILVGESVPYPCIDKNEPKEKEEMFAVEDEDLYLYHMKGDDITPGPSEVSQESNLLVESTTTENDDFIGYINSRLCQDEGESEEQDILFSMKHDGIKNQKGIPYKRKLSNDTSPSTNSIKILKCTSLSKPKSPKNEISVTITNTTEYAPETNNAKSFSNAQNSKKFSIPDNDLSPLSEVYEISEINSESVIEPDQVTTFIFKGEEYVQMPKDYYVKEKMELLEKIKRMENVIQNIKGQLDSL